MRAGALGVAEVSLKFVRYGPACGRSAGRGAPTLKRDASAKACWARAATGHAAIPPSSVPNLSSERLVIQAVTFPVFSTT